MVFPLDRHFGLYEDLGLCVVPHEMLCVYEYVDAFVSMFLCGRLLVTSPQCLFRCSVTKLLGSFAKAKMGARHQNLAQCCVCNRFGRTRITLASSNTKITAC